jgi:hypothetical protein
MRAARQPISGHVLRVERMRGRAGYAKSRLPDERQVEKRIGRFKAALRRAQLRPPAVPGLRHAPRPDDAAVIANVFATPAPADVGREVGELRGES